MTQETRGLNTVTGEQEIALLTQQSNTGSKRYSHIKTEDVVSFFQAKGWTKVFTSAKKRNGKDKQKHIVVMRDESVMFHSGHPQVAIGNSYDLSYAFNLTAGFFRTICANGCFAGESIYEFKTKHQNVIDLPVLLENEYEKIVAAFSKMKTQIDVLKSKQLTYDDKVRLGTQALEQTGFNFKPDENGTATKVIDWAEVFKSERPEEQDSSAWTALNLLQERVMSKGVIVLNRSKRNKSFPALRNNGRRLDGNKIIWETFAAQETVAA